MAPGLGVSDLRTRDLNKCQCEPGRGWYGGPCRYHLGCAMGNVGSAEFPPAIMASWMLFGWGDHDTKTGRFAENALLSRDYYQVQEIPSADFQSREAPATKTSLQGLRAAINYRARGDSSAGLAVEVIYEPRYGAAAAGMHVLKLA